MITAMHLDIDHVSLALAGLGFGSVSAITDMDGGSSPTVKVAFATGSIVVLKTYPEAFGQSPWQESFAAGLLKQVAVPVTRYLLIDDTREKLPFRFAVTNYLPGVTAGSLRNHPDIAGLYRQTGALLRSLHRIALPAYGSFGADGIVEPMPSNSAHMRGRIEHAFEQFSIYGADAELAARLRGIVDDGFDTIVSYSTGPVFSHDDLHPNNVLALEDDQGKLVLSGLIDFGNAFAGDAVSDLAKCLFCSEHDAPGSTAHILAGYGPIDHPDPQGALEFYTLVHRVVMWWWLRHVGVLPTADTPSEIIEALRTAARR